MSRPLMRLSVVQMEELFAVSKTDGKVLKELAEELSYRHVPRAVGLLARVRNALLSSETSANLPPVKAPAGVPPSTPRQSDLTLALLVLEPPATPIPTPSKTGVVRDVPAPHQPLSPSLVLPTKVDAVFKLSIGDAYKILRATPSSSWESIEQSRRQLVQQAHPDFIRDLSPEWRADIQQKAKRANAAYALLCAERIK